MFAFVPRADTSFRGLQTDVLVREIAKRSVVAARRRLNAGAVAMGDAELRGYVRARALRPIRTQARQMAAERHWRAAVVDELIARALDRTIHLLVRELLVRLVVALPPPHVPMRAAG